MVDKLNELWSTLSRKILASTLTDDGAVFPVLEIVKSNANWFSPKERPIWRGVLQCLDSNTPPTVEAVLSRCHETTDLGYLQSIANLFNDEDNRHLIYHAQQLKALGIWAEARRIGHELEQVESPEKLDEAIDHATVALAGLYADKSERDAAGAVIDAETWEAMESFSAVAVPTGLDWFDKESGGFWQGMNYWIVAPYKAGKSTIMRNLILYAAQKGYPVSAYCAEGTREMFMLDCQAMLAAQQIIGAWGIEVREELRLSGLFIKRSWLKHKEKPVFKQDEYRAIQAAREIWRGLPIRVYDTRDSIRDLTTLHYNVKRDKMKFGTVAVWMDYSQLFGRGPTLFERQSATALKVQEIAQNEDVVMCALAQKNEADIKDSGKSYSAGVKGGGDATAAADGLLIPEIDKELRHIMRIELKHSRHTAPLRGMHMIDPASGLILGELQQTATNLE